jgi:hypothetical protein
LCPKLILYPDMHARIRISRSNTIASGLLIMHVPNSKGGSSVNYYRFKLNMHWQNKCITKQAKIGRLAGYKERTTNYTCDYFLIWHCLFWRVLKLMLNDSISANFVKNDCIASELNKSSYLTTNWHRVVRYVPIISQNKSKQRVLQFYIFNPSPLFWGLGLLPIQFLALLGD